MKVIVFVLTLLALTLGQNTCRFAAKYTTDQMLNNLTAQKEFLNEVVTWEAKFIHQVGVENSSGYTHDGQRVDYDSG